MPNERLSLMLFVLTVVYITVCTMLIGTAIDQSRIEIIQEIHRVK